MRAGKIKWTASMIAVRVMRIGAAHEKFILFLFKIYFQDFKDMKQLIPVAKNNSRPLKSKLLQVPN